jgi:site-specific recombinase
MAFCGTMRILRALPHFISVVFHLVRDVLRFLLLGTRSNAAVKAENIFLRKQSRRDLSRINMASADYISQVHKFNSFMQNGVFGRDSFMGGDPMV